MLTLGIPVWRHISGLEHVTAQSQSSSVLTQGVLQPGSLLIYLNPRGVHSLPTVLPHRKSSTLFLPQLLLARLQTHIALISRPFTLSQGFQVWVYWVSSCSADWGLRSHQAAMLQRCLWWPSPATDQEQGKDRGGIKETFLGLCLAAKMTNRIWAKWRQAWRVRCIERKKWRMMKMSR